MAANRTVYVVDSGNHRVQSFGEMGQYAAQWGSRASAEGQISETECVAVGPDGSVYVCENTNQRIQRFTAGGIFLNQWGSLGSEAGKLNGAKGAAVGPNGVVYVADSGNHRIQYFSADGQSLGQWGIKGTRDGQFNTPSGVAVAADGTVYVADTKNYRIQRFGASGNFLGKWGTWGALNGQMKSPEGLAVAPDGSVYVADTGGNRIQRFSAAGEYMGQWGAKGAGPGQFVQPKGVAVAAVGGGGTWLVYVADTENHRVQYFGPTGEYLGAWGEQGIGDRGFRLPRDVASDAGGAIYVADSDNQRVQVYGATLPSAWRGEYVNSRWLAGRPLVLREDQAIDFDWGAGSPDASLPADNFGVRWRRYVSLDRGFYRFSVRAQGAVRLWVDGQMVIEAPVDGSMDEAKMILVPEDGNHVLQLEYGEASGEASAHLSWERVILPPRLYLALTVKSPGTWYPTRAPQP